MKKPDHCKGCGAFTNAGHKNNQYQNSKYNCWCSAHSTTAPKAVSICKLQKTKENRLKRNEEFLAALKIDCYKF